MSPVEPSSINSQHDASTGSLPLPRTAEGPHDSEDHLRGLKARLLACLIRQFYRSQPQGHTEREYHPAR